MQKMGWNSLTYNTLKHINQFGSARDILNFSETARRHSCCRFHGFYIFRLNSEVLVRKFLRSSLALLKITAFDAWVAFAQDWYV